MTPLNNAVSHYLAIWNDVVPREDLAFRNWHTHQHLPERVSIDGMNRGRRFMRIGDVGEQYCTIIDLSDIDVLKSREYVTRLNSPTPWTTEMSGNYLNFYRCALTTRYSWRSGFGGFLTTLRIDLNEESQIDACMDALWKGLAPYRSRDTVAMSIGPVNTNATAAISKETEARRKTGESVTDVIVFIEANTGERSEMMAKILQDLAQPYALKLSASAYTLQFVVTPDIARAVYRRNLNDPDQGYR